MFFPRRSLLSFRMFLLQPLLLLGMPLLQLLRLLLMPLFHLLLPAFIRILSCELPVFLVLLLLQFLPVLFLLRKQLFLLLLIFSVLLGIPCIWRTGPWNWRQFLRMHRARATSIVPWPRIPRACIPPALVMNSACLSRLHHSAFVKCSRPRSSGDGRLASVYGRS